MKTLIYGVAAAVLGIIGLFIWFKPFLNIITGVVPIMLLLGGGLAVYLGYDELKNNAKQENNTINSDTEIKVKECEDEIAKLKEDIASLKENKS